MKNKISIIGVLLLILLVVLGGVNVYFLNEIKNTETKINNQEEKTEEEKEEKIDCRKVQKNLEETYKNITGVDVEISLFIASGKGEDKVYQYDIIMQNQPQQIVEQVKKELQNKCDEYTKSNDNNETYKINIIVV